MRQKAFLWFFKSGDEYLRINICPTIGSCAFIIENYFKNIMYFFPKLIRNKCLTFDIIIMLNRITEQNKTTT